MGLIRSKDTGPEMRVRQLLWKLGYRYRLHVKTMPGRPDIVFRSRRKVIFVHGCFWHRHAGCRLARMPKSRIDFWEQKFAGNVRRDAAVLAEYDSIGWNVLIVWECEVADEVVLRTKLKNFLSEVL
ncbi:very short patch repair endonuclease [Ralstonia solanacearum]|nr:very short patch repair endonuclease [Ralstonia solanacearum]